MTALDHILSVVAFPASCRIHSFYNWRERDATERNSLDHPWSCHAFKRPAMVAVDTVALAVLQSTTRMRDRLMMRSLELFVTKSLYSPRGLKQIKCNLAESGVFFHGYSIDNDLQSHVDMPLCASRGSSY